jgi:hypothetical protein
LRSYSRTSQHFMEPEGSLPRSQEPSTGPYLEPDQPNPSYLFKIHFTSNIPSTKSHIHFLSLRSFIPGIRPGPRLLVIFRNKLIFYGEELLAPRSTPQLEDHPLSAVRDCLPSISGGRLLHPQPEDAPCRGDKGPTYTLHL